MANHHRGTICFVDLETTGLNPHEHEIIELGAVVSDWPYDQVRVDANIRIKPERIHLASHEALARNGYNEPEWAHAVDLKAGLDRFRGISSRMIWCSHKTDFDMRFLSASLTRVGLSPDLGFYVFDTLSMAWALLPAGSVANYRLDTIAEFFGIEREADRHEAVNGANLCRRVYAQLVNLREGLYAPREAANV